MDLNWSLSMWSMLDPHSEDPCTLRMGKESWDNAATCCLENMSEPPAGAAALDFTLRGTVLIES